MTHTATLLPSGLVLVAGGLADVARPPPEVQFDSLATAELYDPSLGIWTPTGSMQSPRSRHAAFLTSEGKVLVVGGCASFAWQSNYWYFHCLPLPTTELYDPATGEWELGPELPYPPGYWNVVELADGKLLAAGTLESQWAVPGAASQLLDPATNLWEIVGSMQLPRVHQRMVLLDTGEVLALGGIANWSFVGEVQGAAELYDPVERTWRGTATPPVARVREVLIRLPDGNVLFAGGCPSTAWFCLESVGYPPLTPQAWIYDRTTQTWRETSPMNYSHVWPSSVVLDSGKVLVAAGNYQRTTPDGRFDYYPSPTSEVFDPDTETWSPTGPMPHYVMGGGALVKLPSGAVLFTGGYVNGWGTLDCVGISSAQVYR